MNEMTFCVHDIFKMAVVPRVIYISNAIPLESSMASFLFGRNLYGIARDKFERDQNNCEKEKQSWNIHISQFQNILQGYSNQNCGADIKTDIYSGHCI